MNRKISLGAALALMLLVASVAVTITWDNATKAANELMNALRARESSQAKYAEIDREVRANYNGVIDETQLLDNVARGYLAGIGDKYATYYDARTYERVQRARTNPTADIGAVLRDDPEGAGYLTVLEVYPDSPALGVGIQAGDLIIKIDDTSLTPENSTQMLESLKGEEGTKVALTVRSGSTDRVEELTRRVVTVPSVYLQMLGADSSVAYVNIVEFNDKTADQFSVALRRLNDQAAQSIIFDLRDNPGGTLSAATRILDYLVPGGALVSSLDKNGNINLLDSSGANELNIPMVVLINGGTASAAELFAQVLKDYDKARTAGTLTTGKGVMQQVITLTDGSAIELTVAKLVSPAGVVFDGVGIKPDYEVALDGDWKGLGEDLDPQLKKAIEVAVAMHKTGEALQEQSQTEQSQPEESSQPAVTPPEASEDESSPGEDDASQEETSGDEEESQEEDDASREESGEEESSQEESP